MENSSYSTPMGCGNSETVENVVVAPRVFQEAYIPTKPLPEPQESLKLLKTQAVSIQEFQQIRPASTLVLNQLQVENLVEIPVVVERKKTVADYLSTFLKKWQSYDATQQYLATEFFLVAPDSAVVTVSSQLDSDPVLAVEKLPDNDFIKAKFIKQYDSNVTVRKPTHLQLAHAALVLGADLAPRFRQNNDVLLETHCETYCEEYEHRLVKLAVLVKTPKEAFRSLVRDVIYPGTVAELFFEEAAPRLENWHLVELLRGMFGVVGTDISGLEDMLVRFYKGKELVEAAQRWAGK